MKAQAQGAWIRQKRPSARDTRTGFHTGRENPWKNPNPSNQETVGDQLIEYLSRLVYLPLGEGAAVCEVCGDRLREGASLVVFAFRPAEQSAFQVGPVKCVECRHEPTEYFTLGVRELVVEVVSARGVILTCRCLATAQGVSRRDGLE